MNPPSKSYPRIVVLDCYSQYTLLIPRILRESFGMRAVVLKPEQAAAWLQNHEVDAFIISGGAPSIHDAGAPAIPQEILDLTTESLIPTPMLCICYGMQWIANYLGGMVESNPDHREYGPATIDVSDESQLFKSMSRSIPVWASHGDSVVKVPEGFKVTANSSNSMCIAAMENSERLIYCVQFHPEVRHTDKGELIFLHFLQKTKCRRDWKPRNLIMAIQSRTIAEAKEADGGLLKRYVLAYSGGVDSTVTAAILAKKFGDDLLAITIDGGHLREGELEVIRLHEKEAGVSLHVVDAKKRFENAFSTTTDAEKKRLLFKKIYVEILREEAAKFGASFIIQGTLATDLIESGSTGGEEIKNHHNANLKFEGLTQLHPLRNLFKYEVRELAKQLKLPESVWNRKPFPGPGLFIRIVGTHVTQELLDAVRWADAETEKILTKHDVFKDISQLVVYYNGANTVCIKGDARSYVGSIVVRGVVTQDFMTADAYFFSEAVVRELCSVLTRHPLIGRVLIDVTPKPPGPTEPE